MKKLLKLSVVTVVYNGEELLEGTIQSVLGQTYPEIEYIVLDGQSKDNTVDIIKRYEDNISLWKSEPDKGLYDAMNKGIQLATGDFIVFMNAGDHFHATDTVAKMFAQYTVDTDVFFGEVMLVNDDRQPQGTRSERTTQKLPKELTWKSLQKGMVVCHQGFIPRISLIEPYLEDNLCADIDWVIKILKKSRRNTNTNLIIADYLMGGVSKKRHQQSLKDRFQVLQKHYGYFPTLIAHVQIVLRAVWYKVSGKAKY